MNSLITVLITHDHKLIRETWSKIIDDNPQFKVVAACSNTEEAIEKAEEYSPMVAIVDISRKGLDGFEATKKIRERLPELKVLGISHHDQPPYATRMLKAGATGYLTRDVSISELFQALMEVSSGKRYISRDVLFRLSRDFMNDESPAKLLQSLSPREMEITELICKGYTSKQIAQHLFLSEGTIQVHRHNIYKKLKITKTAKLLNLMNEYRGVA